MKQIKTLSNSFVLVETDNDWRVLNELGFRKSGLSYLIKNKKECLVSYNGSYLINIWFDRITYNNDWAQNYFIGKNDNDKIFGKYILTTISSNISKC